MASTVAKKLARRLRELRKEHGFTQQEAAARCRIKYKYYQEHEGNKPRDVRLSTLEKIAKGFGVRLSKLLDFE
jgi:transcriptional regulator with XRE-family HTH domain